MLIELPDNTPTQRVLDFAADLGLEARHCFQGQQRIIRLRQPAPVPNGVRTLRPVGTRPATGPTGGDAA